MEILIVVFIVAAFYFILVRPVVQQQKRHKSDISGLQLGDEVLTTGGFYAIVREINTQDDRDTEIVLEAAPGLLLRGTAAAVGSVTRRASPGEGQAASAES